MHNPDLLLLGGRIHALGQHAPAEALLVRRGQVAALGSEAEVRAAAGPGTRIISLDGAVVTPGLTDAHVHLTAWGLARQQVDLASARTLESALYRSAGYRGEGWVRGHGWDAHRWGALPTRHQLDRVVPDRPALLDSHDLHAAWLNSAALARCGISRDTQDPPGGQIVRDADGEPTGILLETAVRLAAVHLPEPSRAEVQAALLDAQGALHAWGITGVHSVEASGRKDWQELRAAGALRLRVLQSIPLDELDSAVEEGLRSGAGDEWIRTGGVKMFLDGALGSRTALLREPYQGELAYRGISTLVPHIFREAAKRAARAGIATTVHAIGDAAVGLALDVLSEVPPPSALPHRIEHLQLCPPEWWGRAARAGIVASMQPVHVRSDIAAAEQHWGHARCRGAYAFAPLLHASTVLAFGSDAPVETPDPRQGLYAATARVGWEGEPSGGWFPEHKLTP
ncbi:amidohydrolase [soil metagenome]